MNLTSPHDRRALAAVYRDALLGDVVPFWLRHGLDREHGGFLTALDRDGTVVDTDKAIWFQGRGAWTFATLYVISLAGVFWLRFRQGKWKTMRVIEAAPDLEEAELTAPEVLVSPAGETAELLHSLDLDVEHAD